MYRVSASLPVAVSCVFGPVNPPLEGLGAGQISPSSSSSGMHTQDSHRRSRSSFSSRAQHVVDARALTSPAAPVHGSTDPASTGLVPASAWSPLGGLRPEEPPLREGFGFQPPWFPRDVEARTGCGRSAEAGPPVPTSPQGGTHPEGGRSQLLEARAPIDGTTHLHREGPCGHHSGPYSRSHIPGGAHLTRLWRPGSGRPPPGQVGRKLRRELPTARRAPATSGRRGLPVDGPAPDEHRDRRFAPR